MNNKRHVAQMTKREMERAFLIAKDTYPPYQTCAECGCIWMEHMGEFCPSRDPEFYERSMAVLEGKLPTEAIRFHFRGTLFLPLLNAERDFALV